MDPSNQQPQTQQPANLTPKQQIAEQIKAAANIVVSTNKQPTLDEITTVIGFTHMLQAMGKHATGVISTTLPKAVEFLNPKAVIEGDTKRLQDFVVSLHKDKADKLRYKVDGDHVKIFITPYKTVISEKDFSFTAGDYNIDTVVAVGVMQRNDVDDALLVSPRILGDTKVVTLNKGEAVSTFGAVNWSEPQAVSVAEMAMSISESLGSGLLKPESSQALLTGLVSATDQFGNDLTTPKIMTMAAQLMAAGADQQVIVKNLQDANHVKVVSNAADQPEPVAEKTNEQPTKAHAKPVKNEQAQPEQKSDASEQKPEPKEEKTVSEVAREEQPASEPAKKEQPKTNSDTKSEPHVNTSPELPTLKSVLENKAVPTQEQASQKPASESAHKTATDNTGVDSARAAVKQAEDARAPKNPEPTQSLNAQNVENNSSGDIEIDHNGDILLPQ